MWPTAILDLWGNFGTSHNENLVIFITVQNLVAITSVVLTIQKFDYFVHSHENAYSRPFLAVLGVKIWENGKYLHCYPSRNAIIQN